MAEKLQAPRGTFDVLPHEGNGRWLLLNENAEPKFERFGYKRIETPMFEDTALFARGVGESTDVVSKEMYTFEDQGGRSLTLRPEGTASICRAYVQHGMHKLPQPVKLWYHGPFFRQEAPQAGRFRQFFQIGAEALGSDAPALDAESIALLAGILAEAGVESRLRISSLGSADERNEYSEELKKYLRANEAKLARNVVERIDLNPLRAFDSGDERTQATMAEAPKLIERISSEDREHFEQVRKLLDALGIGYEVDPTLVRGLDYYTRTVFEFTSDQLGAQSGVAGGGRYDGLVEMLGGPSTPGVGWAAGVERILAAGKKTADDLPARVYVAYDVDADLAAAMNLGRWLRERIEGWTAVELAGRSLKGQLKQADRVDAEWVVIFGRGRGQYDPAVKNMKTGEQFTLKAPTRDNYVDQVIDIVGHEAET